MKTILLKILLLFGFIFSTTFLFGQDKCDLSKLSKTDKQILDNFWNDFKGAINSRDTQKLASLCSFPFPCSYCKKKITYCLGAWHTQRNFYNRCQIWAYNFSFSCRRR